jgi:hypothetical protein
MLFINKIQIRSSLSDWDLRFYLFIVITQKYKISSNNKERYDSHVTKSKIRLAN